MQLADGDEVRFRFTEPVGAVEGAAAAGQRIGPLLRRQAGHLLLAQQHAERLDRVLVAAKRHLKLGQAQSRLDRRRIVTVAEGLERRRRLVRTLGPQQRVGPAKSRGRPIAGIRHESIGRRRLIVAVVRRQGVGLLEQTAGARDVIRRHLRGTGEEPHGLGAAPQPQERPAPPFQHMGIERIAGEGLHQNLVFTRRRRIVADGQQTVRQPKLRRGAFRRIGLFAHERGYLPITLRAAGGIGEQREPEREPGLLRQHGLAGAQHGIRRHAHGVVGRPGGQQAFGQRTGGQYESTRVRVRPAGDKSLAELLRPGRIAGLCRKVGGQQTRLVSGRSRRFPLHFLLEQRQRPGRIAEPRLRPRPFDGVLRARADIQHQRRGRFRVGGIRGGGVAGIRFKPRQQTPCEHRIGARRKRCRQQRARDIGLPAAQVRPRAPIAEALPRRVLPGIEAGEHLVGAFRTRQRLQLHQARQIPHLGRRRDGRRVGGMLRRQLPEAVPQRPPRHRKVVLIRPEGDGSQQHGGQRQDGEEAAHCSEPR